MNCRIAILSAVTVAAIFQPCAFASGSIAAGKGISPRAAYTQGKAVTFKKLVCETCPLQKGELDKDRAGSLRASLEARYADTKPGTPDDENIQVLCPGPKGTGCDAGVDEQELVHYYLTRRYKL